MESASSRVLLVEDNRADQEMIRRCLQACGPTHQLRVLSDGQQAMEDLGMAGASASAGVSLPDLVLLDLNLPRLSGYEVLQRIRECERLRHLPVVILSTSRAHEDVLRSYRAGCSCFLTKPTGYNEFRDLMDVLCRFWLSTARLPRV